jgi:hypothetical protein
VAAGTAVLILAVFAALNRLQIAPEIVNGLFFAILAIIVGSAVVAIGGGGIPVARRYWERAAERTERESEAAPSELQGAKERVQQRAQERADQARPDDDTASGRIGSESARRRSY